ncbi:hypothetical protein AeRB84_007949 [Aphanomyces euteiches]|nr:hypothetical protein AeRB84_007949 [Aphanomyces euteiches]
MPPVANRTSFADDISDGASTWDGVVELTDRILTRLTYFNISISAMESKFGKLSTDLLGHIISGDGLTAAPRGLQQVLDMPFPKTLREMQSFTGSLNFYSRFIENYSVKAACLYEITEDQFASGQVSDAAKETFDDLKLAYASTPILKHANPELAYHVVIYTTNWAISATLCQEYDGILHPVRFCGRVLKGSEPKQPMWAKEILALLRVIDVCYYELAGKQLNVYTQH